MQTMLPPRPTPFEPGWHALRLRKLEIQPDPGVGRTGRRLRLVFDAHRLEDDGRTGPLVDRLHIFEPIAGDLATASGPFRALLTHLGLDPVVARPDRLAPGPGGGWAWGLVGSPDLETGYQPLLDSRPMRDREPGDPEPYSPGSAPAGRPAARPANRPGGEDEAAIHPVADRAGSEASPRTGPPGEASADREADLAPAPLLELRGPSGRGVNRVRVARLAGTAGGRFEGVGLDLGRGQLFFLSMLAASKQHREQDGAVWTVVREDVAASSLLDWVRRDYLEGGREAPEYRLSKNWDRLVKQLRDVAGLGKLLRFFPRTRVQGKFFAIRLRPGESIDVLPPLDQLLAGPSR